MKKILHLFGALVAVGAVVACNNEDSYNEGLTPIDSKINISLSEEIGTLPRTFLLHCSTERTYSSGSNPIIVEYQRSSNTIDISFKGVSQIGMTCDVGPARAIINLGTLNNGTYNFNIYEGILKKGTGKLIVSSDRYEVRFDNNSAFNFVGKQLNRIPEYTIWGHVGYFDLETASLVQTFLNDLMDLGAKKKSYQPGDYYWFQIDKNGEIFSNGLWGYRHIRHFIFHYSGDLEKVEQLVKRYALDFGAEMNIRIDTEQGAQFLSWMYD